MDSFNKDPSEMVRVLLCRKTTSSLPTSMGSVGLFTVALRNEHGPSVISKCLPQAVVLVM